MYIDNKHNIGAVVYLLCDPDQQKRVVTGILVKSGGYIEYGLSSAENTTWHVETEITTEKSLVI